MENTSQHSWRDIWWRYGRHTAEEFATFSQTRSRQSERRLLPTPLYDLVCKVTPVLADWSTVTVDEVGKLIGSAPAKARQLFPVPTWLAKDFRGLLSPFVALLCNTSLVTGCFPSEFKQAVIRPLLKKNGLDNSEMKNFGQCRIYRSFLNYWRGSFSVDYRRFSTATT